MDANIKIDEGLVSKIISKEVKKKIAVALADKPGLIEKVVNEMLSYRANSYDPPLWNAMLQKMVSAVAKIVFKDWVESQEDKIKLAIEKRLKKEPQAFVDKIANQIVDGLAENFYVSCNLKLEE